MTSNSFVHFSSLSDFFCCWGGNFLCVCFIHTFFFFFIITFLFTLRFIQMYIPTFFSTNTRFNFYLQNSLFIIIFVLSICTFLSPSLIQFFFFLVFFWYLFIYLFIFIQLTPSMAIKTTTMQRFTETDKKREGTKNRTLGDDLHCI